MRLKLLHQKMPLLLWVRVIDPEMSDELRVTVVATGIGDRKPDISLVTAAKPSFAVNDKTPNSFVSSTEVGSAAVKVDYRAAQSAAPSTATEVEKAPDDYLDVPAFLRKQAD